MLNHNHNISNQVFELVLPPAYEKYLSGDALCAGAAFFRIGARGWG